MSNISIRQLRYLEALAHCGHFGKAAQRCNISQPALSMQIKALEGELGINLVERKTDGVALTAHGEEVVARAKDILTRLEDLSDFVQTLEKPLTGRLKTWYYSHDWALYFATFDLQSRRRLSETAS